MRTILGGRSEESRVEILMDMLIRRRNGEEEVEVLLKKEPEEERGILLNRLECGEERRLRLRTAKDDAGSPLDVSLCRKRGEGKGEGPEKVKGSCTELDRTRVGRVKEREGWSRG